MSARPPSETLLQELRQAIDRDAEVPVGVQLAWALRSRIQGGSARPGDRLPGLREVAAATGLNHNTVRAVFQRLDAEGLIDSRQGSGTFVASVGSAPAHARSIAADAAREAHRTGVDPRDVAAALYVSPAVSSSESAGSAEAGERRRELRAQIGALERAIGELESEHPGVAPAAPRARRAGGPALLSVQELQQVRAALVRRLASVQNAIDAEAHIEAPRARAPRAQRSSASTPAPAPSKPSRPARDAGSSPSPPAKPKRAGRAPRRVRPAAAET